MKAFFKTRGGKKTKQAYSSIENNQKIDITCNYENTLIFKKKKKT